VIAQLRNVILAADSDMAEEWKWNTPVWTCHGLVCGSCAFKDHVKLKFFNGASLRVRPVETAGILLPRVFRFNPFPPGVHPEGPRFLQPAPGDLPAGSAPH